MGRSNGMGQLAKGIVIGIILILAIIGTMSIFNPSSDQQIYKPETTKNTPATTPPAPSINVTTNQNNAEQTQNTTTPSATTNPAASVNNDPVDNNPDATEKTAKNTGFKPILENERVLKEKPLPKKEKKKIQYGLLQLSSVNPNTHQKQKVNFVILDKSGKKVASANNTKESLFRLPVGKYKVITTLNKPENAVRGTQPVKTTHWVRISKNKKTSQSFKLEPPITIGVLQVSAKNANNGRSIKANYIVQSENGQTIASRKNVTHTLFKLKAGSYKVTVRNGNSSDSRTVVVEPGQSTNHEFKLLETIKLGRIQVRVLDTRSNKRVNADIIITKSNGEPIQQLTAVSQTELSLPAGQYKIRVTGPTGQSNKNITISAGQTSNQVFRFDIPQPTQKTEVQITDNVKITPDRQTSTTKSVTTKSTANNTSVNKTTKEVKQAPQAKGSLLLYARNKRDNVPLKSNFYIQKMDGRNVAKKVYSESAQFSLKPGIYRVTVRSKNRKNITKTIRISSGERLSEVFALKSTLPPVPPTAPKNPLPKTQQASTAPVLAPQKPSKPIQQAIPTGFLNIAMRPAKKTHFIVATRSGRKVVELTSVPNARFKLDTGEYIVTAIRNKQRRSKNISVRTNQTAHIQFNAANFQTPVTSRNTRRNISIANGVLRSRIINNTGKPLRGDLTVTNMRGQVVARANGVTVGVFDLPPEPHTIILNYRGLRGSERVNIRPRETTMQTFTVAPNESRPATPPPARREQQPGDIKDFLQDKLEQEIRRRF